MDPYEEEGNLLSPEAALELSINTTILKGFFPSISESAWQSARCNVAKHCIDEWMRSNWEMYRRRVRCSSKKEKDEVGWQFIVLLWHTRNGLNIDWESFDISDRSPSQSISAEKPRNDVGPGSPNETVTEAILNKRKRKSVEVDPGCSKWHQDELMAWQLDSDILVNSNLVKFLKIRKRDISRADVMIALSDSHLFADSLILATRSPFFEKLLRSEGPETQTSTELRVIKVDHYNLEFHVVQAVIDFFYSGEITFSELVPPHEVLKASHVFQVGFLTYLTEAERCRALSVDNVLEMLKLSRRYSALRLQEEAWELFKENVDILRGRVFDLMEGPSHSFDSRTTLDSTPRESKFRENRSISCKNKREKS